MPNKIDLTGRKFGRLTVVSEAERISKRIRWICLCECGKIKNVDSTHLSSGLTKSCGCLNVEKIGQLNRTHGRSRTSEYNAWLAMRDRCNNPKNSDYARYGGRGIKVCSEWNNSFECFLADMGFKPTPSHTLDRENNDLGYNRENCRWVTQLEQCNNRSNNRAYEFSGGVYTLSELSRLTGIDRGTLLYRLNSSDDIEAAISKPLKPDKYVYNGQAYTISELSILTGVNYRTLLNRIHRGMSINDAIIKKDPRKFNS